MIGAPRIDALDSFHGNEQGHGQVINSSADLVGRRAVVQTRHALDWVACMEIDNEPTGLSAASRRTLKRDLWAWLRFLDDQVCDQPTAQTIAAFIDRQKASCSVNTVNNRLAALKHFYAWCARRGVFPNIAMGFPRLSPQLSALAPVSRSAHLANRLLELMTGRSLKGLQKRAIIGLLGSGLETIAIHRARVGDVHRASRSVRFHPRGHSAADALVVLDPAVMLALQQYLDARAAQGPLPADAPLVTPTTDPTKPLSTLSMRVLVRQVGDELGVAGGRLTTSALRCTGTVGLLADYGMPGAARRMACRTSNLRRLAHRLIQPSAATPETLNA